MLAILLSKLTNLCKYVKIKASYKKSQNKEGG